MRIFTNSLVTAALVAAVLPTALAAQVGNTPRVGNPLEPGETSTPTRQGTRGANFLQIGVGARANAMAGAAVASVSGPTAWYWNPAGAGGIEGFSVHASRQDLYTDLDIAHNYAGLAIPLFGNVVGVSWTQLNSGDIERTTPSNPFGDDPILGGSFEWSSTAIGLHLARRLTDRLDVGVGAKYISEGIDRASTTWYALDMGTQFRTGIYGVTVAGSLLNIGGSARAKGAALERVINTDQVSPQITLASARTRDTELPTAFRFSIGNDVLGTPSSLLGQRIGRHALTTELNFTDAVDTDIQVAFGAEYSWADRFFVRGGKRFYNDDRDVGGSSGSYGLSGGIGAALPLGGRSLRIDYGYTAVGDLENIQVFSFEFGR